jgi:enterochelin esterase-like enzyme
MNHFKKIFLSILGICLLNFALCQPMGKVIEEATVKSSILNKAVRYTIYLPADYDRSERTYPVVYLLHGFY